MTSLHVIASLSLVLCASAMAEERLASLRGTFPFDGKDVKGSCDIYPDRVLVTFKNGSGHLSSLTIKSVNVIAAKLIKSPANAANAAKQADQEKVISITSNHTDRGYYAYYDNPAADPSEREVVLSKGSQARKGAASGALRDWIDSNCEGRVAASKELPDDGRIADYRSNNGAVAPDKAVRITCVINVEQTMRAKKVWNKPSVPQFSKTQWTPEIKNRQEFTARYRQAYLDWIKVFNAPVGGGSVTANAYDVNDAAVGTALMLVEPGRLRLGDAARALGDFIRANCE
jgi:hypothetical protein